MKRSVLLFSLIASGLMLTRCSLLPDKAEDLLLRALTDSEKEVVQSDIGFGLTLFRAINQEESDKNLLISPLSVSMALGMTLNGAAGTTYENMAATLEKAGLSEKEINESYRHLLDLMMGLDPQVTVSIANSIWYRNTFEVESDFLEVNQQYFDAVVADLDFDDPESVDIINAWVDQKTSGKIDEIVEEIDWNTVMYLINALYFKGNWIHQFDPDVTADAPFSNADGTTSTVPMMHQENTFPFLHTELFDAVDLPYGDSLFSMTLFLPREAAGVNDLVARLDADSWDDWIDRLSPTRMMLSLPRFTFSYEKSLKDVLSATGMEVAFDPAEADFTGINKNAKDSGLHISEVIHKTFIEVNEEGTEAAAVTSVEISLTSMPMSLTFDRPFVFTISERHSGTILFVGKVMEL